MQVRKSLHKKQNINGAKLIKKYGKNQDKLNSKKKKLNNTFSKKSRSKSRSQSIKQNKVKGKSKSFQKISPFKKNKKSQMLYTSPINYSKNRASHTQYTPLADLSQRRMNTQRDYQKISYGISTKIHTERSPVIIKHGIPHQYSFKNLKTKTKQKKTKAQQGKIKKDKEKSKSKSKDKKKYKKTINSQKTTKMKIPLIRTELPKRKQSYFDEAIYSGISQFYNKQPFSSAGITDQQKSTLQTHFISTKKQNNFTSNSKEVDNTFEIPLSNLKFKTQSIRQFGTSTSQIDFKKVMIEKIEKLQKEQKEKISENYKNQISLRGIESFRKEQELKWKIISLELENIRNRSKPDNVGAFQMLNQLLEISGKNIEELEEQEENIVRENQIFFKSKQAYIIQSPIKVKEALQRQRNRRKSQQQTLEIIKNVSNKKLLQDLEFMKDPSKQQQNSLQKYYISKQQKSSQIIPQPQQKHQQKIQQQKFDSNRNSQQSQQYSSSKSFCIQFQKQLESYVNQNQQNLNKAKIDEEFFNLEIQNIPELEYNKAVEVVSWVEGDLFEEFCAELITKDYLLNNFLHVSKEQIQFREKIQSDNQYAYDLMRGLLRFMLKPQNTQNFHELIINLNKPYGTSPQNCLKWLRNDQDNQDSELTEYIDDLNAPVPVLSIQTIQQYDMKVYPLQSHSQYFMNHCVYSCMNELFDKYRPYGSSGLPSLCRKPPQNLLYNQQSVIRVFAKIQVEFENLVKTRIGRQNFVDENNQELSRNQIQAEIESSLKEMDRFMVQEDSRFEGLKNKMYIGSTEICQEFVFENKLYVSQVIIDDIINQEVLMIFNDFIQ